MNWAKEIDNAVKMYTQGKSIAEIAEHYDCSYSSVDSALKRSGCRSAQNQNVFPAKTAHLKREHIDVLAKNLGASLVSQFSPVKLEEPKARKTTGKEEEVSVLNISDVHVGMENEVYDSTVGTKVMTYNMDIFKKEMAQFEKGIFQIYDLLSPSYKLSTLYINLLGDIVTNDRIFPEQMGEVETSVGVQMWDSVNHLTHLINHLLSRYEKIVVTGVVGNHGRSQSHMYSEPVENNFEYHLYRILQKQFENSKRVTVVVPTTKKTIVDIAGWKHLLMHGDEMRGSSPNAIQKQVSDLYVALGGFDVLDMGHFHKLQETELADHVMVKMNGAWISKDNYALKMFNTYSIPRQWFYGTSKKRHETWNFKLDLRVT
jgi:predicted phosphodiesterase